MTDSHIRLFQFRYRAIIWPLKCLLKNKNWLKQSATITSGLDQLSFHLFGTPMVHPFQFAFLCPIKQKEVLGSSETFLCMIDGR